MFGKLSKLPLRLAHRVARRIQDQDARRQADARADEAPEPDAPGRGIPAHELADLPEREVSVSAAEVVGDAEVCFVDLRSAAAWRAGRVDGAVHLPLSELVIRLAELPWTGRVVVYGDGGDALTAALFLRHRGLDHAYALSGGLDAWRSAGGPVA